MNFLKEEWIAKFKGYKTIENWCKDWNTEGFTLHKRTPKKSMEAIRVCHKKHILYFRYMVKLDRYTWQTQISFEIDTTGNETSLSVYQSPRVKVRYEDLMECLNHEDFVKRLACLYFGEKFGAKVTDVKFNNERKKDFRGKGDLNITFADDILILRSEYKEKKRYRYRYGRTRIIKNWNCLFYIYKVSQKTYGTAKFVLRRHKSGYNMLFCAPVAYTDNKLPVCEIYDNVEDRDLLHKINTLRQLG